MRVEAEVEETTLENDSLIEVEGVCVTCSRCGHCVEVFGTGGPSVRRGLATLREECPEGESNFYIAEGDEDPPFEGEEE